MKYTLKCILFSLLIIISINLVIIPFSNDNNLSSLNITENNREFQVSNSDKEHVIVFFNKSSYNQDIKSTFQDYGGTLKSGNDWSNLFNNISGFAGIIPTENISLFRNNFSGINIEKDEIIETQLNYASFQSGAKNVSWSLNGYTGNTDSSVAVLDSGINLNQVYLKDKIIGWQNFINDSSISDDFGHGTLVSSVIAGTGTDLYNSDIPSKVILKGNYSHLDLFGEDPSPKNFSKKLISFNTSRSDSQIILNSTWSMLENGIDKFWFELYCNNTLVNSSMNILPNQRNLLIHQTSASGLGIYDFYIKYHRQTNKYPVFNIDSNVLIFPEVYVNNNNHFTGIANHSKILAYKIINKTGKGYVSDLITALGSIIQNRTKYHIVTTCLSIATFGNDFGAINKVIDEVVDNGIIVIIAAGNNGIKGSQTSLNRLAINSKAIIVGATNDIDQITSYSGVGEAIDIVAPGGSNLPSHRTVISADSKSNYAATATGTSISTAIISAGTNLLIEAIWGDWNNWENQDAQKRVNIIKSILLMTATETNQEREDDPFTSINEEEYSPTGFSGFLNSLKDEHEGYGRVNLQVAIDALTKYIEINKPMSDFLYSSKENPLGKHAFARRVTLQKDTQYIFNITQLDETADFDMFLFSNMSKQDGEPIILQTSRKWYRNSQFFYFIPKHNQTECVIIIKAVNGYGNFSIEISEVNNVYSPQLKLPEISYYDGSKNTTVMGYQEYSGNYHPHNYSIDRYRFYIDYFDNDSSNVPPQEVYVSIVELSKNFTLSQFNPVDNNFTNGALFLSNYLELREPKTYHYFFVACDGDYKIRYPEIGMLSIFIEYPYDSETFPYNHSFNDGLGNWIINGTGWDLLNQSNFIDNRSNIYNNNWTSMYFGTFHNFPRNYTYQPVLITDQYPNGTLISPLFDFTSLNENFTVPFVKIGIRTSINTGDAILFQISLNWTNWITLEVFNNEEIEWHMEKFNLTQYIGNFIQFRFLAVLDNNFDPINYKGFILDYFELSNYSNSYFPEIYFDLKTDLSSNQGSKFQKFTFFCTYYDRENNYPDFVYIEMDGTNYSMINMIGDWNPINNIRFFKSLILNDFDNRSFRFHASDGKYLNSTPWYNLNNSLFNFINPVPYQFNINFSNKLIGYQFSNMLLDDFYIIGAPYPKENTAWYLGDNTWHPITRLNQKYIYGGIGKSYGSLYQGYGTNWNAKLITRPLYLRNQYNCYLKFNYEIDFQNEYGIAQEDLDRCIISISSDYGESWIILKEYFYDDESLIGNESIDISEYANEVIMVMFTLNSNENTVDLGYGWLLSDIYIGYDNETDFIGPTIQIISPKNQETISSVYNIIANLSDNISLDDSKIYIYIDGNLVERSLYSYNRNNGILEYSWDTTYYTDGPHQIVIMAFDEEGNRNDASINIIIKNGFFNWHSWEPWLLIILSIVIIGTISYKILKKKFNIRTQRSRKTIAERYKLQEMEKQQKKKQIETIELEEENKRPLTLYCKYCKSWFVSHKFDYICPICEHDQVYVAYNCVNCNKWYFKDEPHEDYYCKNKNCEGLRLVRREKEDIKKILEEDGLVLRKFESKKDKFSILD